MKSDPNNYIFTEDIDYSKTPKTSIWGNGDALTLQKLSDMTSSGVIKGNWLHFASGDGRYNDMLLESADSLIATDVDESALEKLKLRTKFDLLHKLHIQTQDITKQFPFSDETFDGVFNTGTLHLFPKEILSNMFREVARVLKDDGLFVFDFATDLKRITPDGAFIGSPNKYDKDSARNILNESLSVNHFTSQFLFDSVLPEKVISSEGEYTFSCNFWLVISNKIKK